MEFVLLDVFQHNAQPHAVEALRSAVAHDIHYICNAVSGFDRVNSNDVDDNFYNSLKEKYDSLLYYGSFNLRISSKRHLANELIWKWTEATGKYTGCQFWSKKAKALFDSQVLSAGGWPISRKLANTIGEKLGAKRRADGENRSTNIRLTHEHVYPIKDMKTLIRGMNRPGLTEIRELFDRQCVGCVVLESEHDRHCGDATNPWTRYAAGGVILADNPEWPVAQRDMLFKAGLLGH
jgi:hypothetical protein